MQGRRQRAAGASWILGMCSARGRGCGLVERESSAACIPMAHKFFDGATVPLIQAVNPMVTAKSIFLPAYGTARLRWHILWTNPKSVTDPDVTQQADTRIIY